MGVLATVVENEKNLDLLIPPSLAFAPEHKIRNIQPLRPGLDGTHRDTRRRDLPS